MQPHMRIIQLFAPSALPILILLGLLVVLPTVTFADPNTKCLAEAKGRDIRWDKAWQADRSDHDVVYRVESIKRVKYPPAIVIELASTGPAKKKKRKARITREHVERMFCQRMVDTGRKKGVLVAYGSGISYTTRGKEINVSYNSREVSPKDLVFRKFHGGAWVPAKARVGEKQVVCKLPTISYACSETDKKSLERHRSATRPHHHPYYKMIVPNGFIRHTANGWKRAEPLGLPVDALMSECQVGNETYSCLAEEKKKHEVDLLTLQKQLEIEQKISR